MLMIIINISFYFFFFFNDTATTEIYTLSLHDALPNSTAYRDALPVAAKAAQTFSSYGAEVVSRSEEHTSELHSQSNLVCRLLLEKKKKKQQGYQHQKYNSTDARQPHI